MSDLKNLVCRNIEQLYPQRFVTISLTRISTAVSTDAFESETTQRLLTL